MKKILTITLCAAACVLLAVAAGAALVIRSLAPVDGAESARTERITVQKGAAWRAVARELSEKRLIRSERSFYLAVRFPRIIAQDEAPVLRSGTYDVSSAMGAADIIAALAQGDQSYVKVSLPEGLTVRKVAERLDAAGICPYESFVAAARSRDLLDSYGIPADSFEGYLFPDTYFLTEGMDAEAVVVTMADNFFAHAAQIPELAGLPGGELFRTVVLASIVEREYRVDAEAPLIASVFANRIGAGMGLYSCATIEYIITEVLGRPHPDIITYADLELESPYNTYKWGGLPPGPISCPGMVALSAAATPAKTDFFYFTLNDTAAGTHTFNETYTSHVQAGIQFKTKKAAGLD